MESLAVTALSIASAVGIGSAPTLDALVRGATGLRPCTFTAGLDTYVGAVDAVEDAPVMGPLAEFDGRNNRLAQLALRADEFQVAVARAARTHGDTRVAVLLGTTTAGVLEGEIAFAGRADGGGNLPPSFSHRHTVDHYSPTEFVRAYLGLRGPAYSVSTACSSSAKVFGDAVQLIAAGACDAAVVGGADSLCQLALRGFASLELLDTKPCRPNDADRSGISIGEAAAFLLLERAGTAHVRLIGYGESCDAYHMSSPDPSGAGAALAMREALVRAGLKPGDIDYVNLHGTGSASNDDAESRAVFDVLGGEVPCSSTKGWTGHTLGAAGAVEAVLSCLCVQHGLVPANLHMRTPDPSFRIALPGRTEHHALEHVLSNSFGFGGNNCSLVFGASN